MKTRKAGHICLLWDEILMVEFKPMDNTHHVQATRKSTCIVINDFHF